MITQWIAKAFRFYNPNATDDIEATPETIERFNLHLVELEKEPLNEMDDALPDCDEEISRPLRLVQCNPGFNGVLPWGGRGFPRLVEGRQADSLADVERPQDGTGGPGEDQADRMSLRRGCGELQPEKPCGGLPTLPRSLEREPDKP